jgi:hypothetical protein
MRLPTALDECLESTETRPSILNEADLPDGTERKTMHHEHVRKRFSQKEMREVINSTPIALARL